ncbi:hypothetical protein DdX_03724 [Ditylenchus destructor]|uniref:Uncharacterized protein n=1 Tax=Ditylenchus destructor TaxID=166010 RepID=A0AAD4R890_9BILA|nr:hypothetical protein DdX_03724 [Ditylenchus destructor]
MKHFVRLSINLCFTLLLFVEVEGQINIRAKRQNVASAGRVNGTGDVSLTGAGNVYKTIDGNVGANGTSEGIATGHGASSILSNSYGITGNKSAQVVGNVASSGNSTKSNSFTYAGVDGNNTNIQSREAGTATGVGNSQVNATGDAYMANGNLTNLYNGNQTVGSVSATGDKASSSSLAMGQSLNWGSILAQMVGTAAAQGTFSAIAKLGFGAGTTKNGINIDAMVSGKSLSGGIASAKAVGGGMVVGDNHTMTADLTGGVDGLGNSSLLGVSNLASNGTINNSTIKTFGEGSINTNGRSSQGLIANSSVGANGSSYGDMIMQGGAYGGNKNMSIADGFWVSDGRNESMLRGIGNILGSGNKDSNASITVDSEYMNSINNNNTGVMVSSRGSSASQNSTQSVLSINNVGQLLTGVNKNVTTNIASTTNSSGVVTGESSNVTGNTFLDMGKQFQMGNSSIEARGGGAGNSSAQTRSQLDLRGSNNAPRNTSINGSVTATGDLTNVMSLSLVTDFGGKQSLFNSQNATVDSRGSGMASAQAYGVFKRK